MTALAEPKCLACGSTGLDVWAVARDVEYASTDDEFRYLHCPECCALSIDPVPRDRLAEIYPESYYSFGGGTGSIVEKAKQWLDRRRFAKLFATIEGEELSALDVGGGSGWLLGEAKRAEPRLRRTVVVDIDAGAKADAEAAGHEFHLSRVEDLEIDTRFDVIFLLNLIEHVDDPVAVLKKMRDLLKPGGCILVKTPNHDSWDARLFRHSSWGGYHCPRHWVLFTPESFAVAAEKAGLGIAGLSLTQGAPFWSVSILEWLQSKGIVRARQGEPMFRHPLFGVLLGLSAAFDILRLPFARCSQMFVRLQPAA
jgi:2-polyprenyl-3-methyl-5-hydroxy-6-metoxy-1,4-benzoquinol methylase